MVSTRLAILLSGLFLVGLFVPATEAFALSPVVPAIDLGPDGSETVAPAPEAGVNVYSPYGMESPLPPAMAPTGTIAPQFTPASLDVDGPYDMLLMRLANEPSLTPARLTGHVADFYKEMGFDTPGSAVTFEENASISFSHSLGDINQDGVTDLLFDQYCISADACLPNTGAVLNNPRGVLENQCAWPHGLLAVSGVDGSNLWNRSKVDFNPMFGTYQGCNNEFIVGTIPNGGHADVLVYQYSTTYAATVYGHIAASEILIKHRIGLLDGANGRTRWVKEFEGHFLGDDAACGCAMTATNLLVNPILQVVNTQGLDYLPSGTGPGLALQGVGFNITTASSILAPPYGTSSYTVLNNYQADEWAMGVEPLTGVQLWERKTFEPSERFQGQQVPDRGQGPNIPIGEVSVRPLLLSVPPLPDTTCFYDNSKNCRPTGQFVPRAAPQRLANWYWGYTPCCYDITGDGVPDLVYMVRESFTFPLNNKEGPYGTRGRIVALDGKSGAPLYDHVVEPDTSDFYNLYVQHFGDATGDGISDYFLHERHVTWDYHHDLSLVDGKDGRIVWNMSVPRELQLLPLGDADKDGMTDFVYLEYTLDIGKVFAFGSLNMGLAYSISNVTFTPIQVRSGATNALLWKYESFEAPADIFAVYASFRINGLPDFDGDGVGDVILDDPLFLPDLTKLHRFTYLSGASGKTIFRLVSAGTFAFPAHIGDVTQDGRDDMLLVNGDINDLWGTVYSGNGTAIWSRRIMATRTSSYASAAPMIRVHPIALGNETQEGDFLLNFQLRVTRVFRTVAINGGAQVASATTTTPQLVRFTGWNGSAEWAIPAIWDQNMTIVVEGPSPASTTYANAHLFDPQADRVPAAALATPVQIAAGTTTFGAAFALSFFLGLRRWGV